MFVKRKFNSLLFIGTTSILFASTIPLISCNKKDESNDGITSTSKSIRMATFNVSFATDNDSTERYQKWYDYMHLNHEQQETLINKWIQSEGKVSSALSNDEKALAERIMQIRNIAAIIQKTRPAILSLNEFNNDGYGNNEIVKLFQDNYLSWGQSLNGWRGGDVQEPIKYPYYESFATNTGLISGMDLNNDGVIATDASKSPDDSFGFGYYHGHYAIAIMSQYELDLNNVRTFQNFKYSDMRDENENRLTSSTIKVIEDSTVPKYDENGNPTNQTWKKGDNWYTDEEWPKLRLSSKNHIDLPVIINGKRIHLLLSHPTPANFNTINNVHTNVTTLRNRYEILFWKKYINNANWIYDDNGIYGGIDGSKEDFVILGDLNADNWNSTNTDQLLNDKDAYRYGIRALINDESINKSIVNGGDKEPKSQGAFDAYNSEAIGDWKINNRFNHENINVITSTFGLKVDWAIPSKNLEVLNSEVYWPGEKELGRFLFVDKYGDEIVKTKQVSSDHRLVYVDIKI